MRVRIYPPSKSAAQSGGVKSCGWLVEAENTTPRLPDPLMGWLSAGDSFSTLQGRLRFPSEKAAISFVKDKGGDVIMAEQLPRRSRPRNYLDNFRIIRPEDEEQSRFAPEAIP